PVDDAGEDVAAHRKPEDRLVDLEAADLVIVQILDGDLHFPQASPSLEPSAGASPPACSDDASFWLPPRNAAGNGTPSGRRRLIASRTSTQPLFGPGTAPLTRITPRSPSAETTSRFCVVTRSAPMWPAIFLPLKTFP